MIRPNEAEGKLPFPTRPLQVQGGVVEGYIIPEDKKAEVLAQLYIFDPVPSLDEERFDLHEGKTFRIRDFRVTWEDGHNWLVSPYYPSSGGTVIDWLPVDFDREEDGEGEEDDVDDMDETDD